MCQSKGRVFTILNSKGVTQNSWNKIEKDVRIILKEAFADEFTTIRIGYCGEISTHIITMVEEMHTTYKKDIYIEATILSKGSIKKAKHKHDALVNTCHAINFRPVASGSRTLTFIRDLIFSADRVAVLKPADSHNNGEQNDFIWFAMDYAKSLGKDLRIIEVPGDGE